MDGGNDDYFSELVLDDDFINSASSRELSAAERERLTKKHEKAQRKQWKVESRQNRPHRRLLRKANTNRGITSLVAVISLLAVFAVVDPFKGSTLHSGDDTAAAVRATDIPTPVVAESETPLGRPAQSTSESRAFKFISTQPGSNQPVTYDPCRPVQVVINSLTAPDDGERMVKEALDRVSAVSGLQFRVEGPTGESSVEDRQPFQKDRYGDRWAPVLIAWTDPGQRSDLKGDVAGVGGSSEATGFDDGKSVFVSGQVALDGPQIQEIMDEDGYDTARAIVMHEVAHLVGLDHVDDETQVMNPYISDVTEFAAGDRNGLVQLGQGTCFKEL